MKSRLVRMLWLCSLALTPGCGDTDAAAPTTTYYGHVAPILKSACTSCHASDASAPFRLDGYEDSKTWAVASVAAMEAGRMPPWLPDPTCREFEGQRTLPQGAIATFETWIAEGMPMGEPEEAVEAPLPHTEAVSSGFVANATALMVQPYTPDPAVPDDYRCFVLDLEFEEDAYMLGSRAHPGQSSLVHHILVYALTGETRDTATAADTGDGYSCFGAPFPSSAGGSKLDDAGALPLLVGSWVPGAQPLAPQPDISTRILAGSRIVMQIHYNTLAGDVTPDYSSFDMMLQSEPTPFLAAARPILLPGLFAPAHEPEAVNEHLFKNYTDEPITIVRLGPHMHLLGSRYRSDVVRADGSIECAIEIPDWDFNWQEGYRLPADEPIVLEPGDGISLQCTYDNSEANQPSTNGVIADPQDVHWGEGTRDEMCMNYLTMVEPYTPSESANGDCGSAGACLAACPEGRTSVECLLDCDDTLACYGCALTETVGCATACVGALITLTDHWSFGTCYVNRMALGSSLDTCLAAEAPEAYEAFAQCAHTFIAGGECNEAFTSCGMVLEEPATEPPG